MSAELLCAEPLLCTGPLESGGPRQHCEEAPEPGAGGEPQRPAGCFLVISPQADPVRVRREIAGLSAYLRRTGRGPVVGPMLGMWVHEHHGPGLPPTDLPADVRRRAGLGESLGSFGISGLWELHLVTGEARAGASEPQET